MLSVLATSSDKLGGSSNGVNDLGSACLLRKRPAILRPSGTSPRPLPSSPDDPPPRPPKRTAPSTNFVLSQSRDDFSAALACFDSRAAPKFRAVRVAAVITRPRSSVAPRSPWNNALVRVVGSRLVCASSLAPRTTVESLRDLSMRGRRTRARSAAGEENLAREAVWNGLRAETVCRSLFGFWATKVSRN